MALVGEKELKIGISAVSALCGKKESGLWNEGQKLFCQISLHKIPSFPDEKES